MISKPETWTDIAFLQIVADMCQVAIHVTGVSDLSEIVPDMLLLLPCDQKPPKALLRVGYWLDRHLVAIVDLVNEKGAAPADLHDGGPSDDAWSSGAPSSALSDFEIRLASLNSNSHEADAAADACPQSTPPSPTASQPEAEVRKLLDTTTASITDEPPRAELLTEQLALDEDWSSWHEELAALQCPGGDGLVGEDARACAGSPGDMRFNVH